LLHLLDANVLITADKNYYPIDRVPEFWDWLIHNGTEGRIKIPLEIIEEICTGTDELAKWLSNKGHRESLQCDEVVDLEIVRRVISDGYAPDLNDIEIDTVGRDPFLVAYALRDPAARCVVTTEISKPKKLRANRKIPDVCNHFNITCHDTFGLIRNLDFSTTWRQKV
jgi:hypothetical protein